VFIPPSYNLVKPKRLYGRHPDPRKRFQAHFPLNLFLNFKTHLY
jgi:hypothetical protein